MELFACRLLTTYQASLGFKIALAGVIGIGLFFAVITQIWEYIDRRCARWFVRWAEGESQECPRLRRVVRRIQRDANCALKYYHEARGANDYYGYGRKQKKLGDHRLRMARRRYQLLLAMVEKRNGR